jgi:hypothetical protein
MIRGTRFLVPVLALLLATSACGSSAKKSDPAADLQVAKGAVLTKTDLPDGYDSSPYQSSDDLPASAKLDFANCMNTKESVFNDAPGEQKVNSDNFDKENVEIQNEVEVYPKKGTVDDNYKLMTKDATPGCLSKLFQSAISAAQSQSTDTTEAGAGATFGTVTVTKLSVSGVGDHVVGFRASVPVTGNGQSETEYVDVVIATKDRAIVTLTATNSGEPFDQATETQLLGKVVGRIGKQLS